MKRTLPILTLAASSALLWGGTSVSSSLAQDTPSAPPDNRAFVMTSQFTRGQVSRYQTQTALSLRFEAKDANRVTWGPSGTMNVLMRYLVKEVKPDGTAQVAVLADGGTLVDATNQALEIPKEPDNYPRIATLDKSGRLIAFKDTGKKLGQTGPFDGLFNQSNLLVNIHFLPMPEKPVKIGETWTARYALPGVKPVAESANPTKSVPDEANDLGAVRVKVTLLGAEKIGTVETLKLQQMVSIPFEAMTDREGKPTSDAQKAAGSIQARMIFTLTAHALPASGRDYG
jgi:hypothetical protein